MTLEELQKLMREYLTSSPVVRGHRVTDVSVSVCDPLPGGMPGWITVQFAPRSPVFRSEEEKALYLLDYLKRDYPQEAEVDYRDTQHLREILTGKIIPDWLLEDED